MRILNPAKITKAYSKSISAMGSVSPPSPDYSAAGEKPPSDSGVKRPSSDSAAVEEPTSDSAAVEEPSDRKLRQVTKFEDRYNMVIPYCAFFRFEMDPTYDPRVDCDTDSEDEAAAKKVAKPEPIEKVIPRLVKYVNQIRESFGFDVDRGVPGWFQGGFYPIDMPRAKREKEWLYEKVMKIVDFAIAEINSDLRYDGKSSIELVKLEKAVVFTPCWMDLLTLVVKTKEKEIGEDDDDDMNEKTIQAIVYEGHGDDPPLTLEQWRFKPVEPDFWYKAPPPPQMSDDDDV